MTTVFSKSWLFSKAANALPEFCIIRATILQSQCRMPLDELWHVLATCYQCIRNTESSFLTDNYEQIVGDARLGSIEQKERQVVFLKGIQEVMKNIQEAIRLESKQAPAESVYTALMSQHQYTATPPPQLPKQTSHSPPPKQVTPSPPPQPQKRKSESPPPEPKKQASPLLDELVALCIGSASICKAFIDKPKVGFADQGVQCLADLKVLSKIDAEAMLRLVDLNGIQIHKILKAVFPA